MQPRVSGQSIPSLPDGCLAVPTLLRRAERRDLARREAVLTRIAAEFRGMPGLVLSVPQASRLLGLSESACERILDTLAHDHVLRRRAGGAYGCV